METYGGSDPTVGRPSFGGAPQHDEMADEAAQLGRSARSRAMGALDGQKEQVCAMLDKLADGLEGDRIGGYVADFARRGGDYLRRHSADELLGTAGEELRARPAALVGASFLVGFAAARLFRR